MYSLLFILTIAVMAFTENTKHVFWYKCIDNNYNLADQTGPNIGGEIVKHQGKVLSATIRGSAGNQDPTITLGNGLDNAQARSFVIWYKDLCDFKLTEGATLKSAKFRGEYRDLWTGSAFQSAGPVKPRVGVVNMNGHFSALRVTPEDLPDDAVWADPLNPLSGSMGFEMSDESFMAEEHKSFNTPSGANGSGLRPLEGIFFEMDITVQTRYILDNHGQLGIAAVVTAGDGSTGKCNLYAYEKFVPNIFSTNPWTKDGNTAHLVLEIENGTLIPKEQNSSEKLHIRTNELKLSSYPNPFNAATQIIYNCGKANSGMLKIYSIDGKVALRQEVRGTGVFFYKATNLSNGVYLCLLSTEDGELSKRLFLRK
ncbi:MAG: T9SS type A sorting domain-containing protein [Fibrobacteres bacterium]|nr:T9SS type A sorting domain-containing protein [Fibrobacterota bacterium]